MKQSLPSRKMRCGTARPLFAPTVRLCLTVGVSLRSCEQGEEGEEEEGGDDAEAGANGEDDDENGAAEEEEEENVEGDQEEGEENGTVAADAEQP